MIVCGVAANVECECGVDGAAPDWFDGADIAASDCFCIVMLLWFGVIVCIRCD